VKVLFAALHHAQFRNFDAVVRELAARGHQVHLTSEEPESLGGQQLVERLAAEQHGVTSDLLPSLDDEPWFDATRRLRVALDYVRALEPRYPEKLRVRAAERTARVVRWAARAPLVGRPATLAALTRFERLMPVSERTIEYLRRHSPDVVVLAALTYARSQQLDLLKAARALQLPVAAAILSWDHLSSKALVHVSPDMVLVWNDVQRQEAVEMHGLAAERVVATGAQCYDHWFVKKPERGREEFCRAVGLRADRPFALWVHSALTPTPNPPEPELVVRWIEALRAHPDPQLRELGVLVRPHPERMKEWKGVSLDGFENVAFHGRNPIDREARDDYFDSLYYSASVIGLVTSAFLEAAIVGRPVLTFTLPEYRMHQEEMIHFRYLTTVNGGVLHRAPDLETHFQQLAGAVAAHLRRDERNLRFLSGFVRPHGLDVPATPAFVDALERLHRQRPLRDPSLNAAAWLRPAAMALAARSRVGVGRWLMNDERADEWDERDAYTDRAVAGRIEAKDKWQREKARRKAWRHRRERAVYAAKKARSLMRRARHRTAVAVYRALYVTRLWRGELPGRTGHE
jgi:hypothetical protein